MKDKPKQWILALRLPELWREKIEKKALADQRLVSAWIRKTIGKEIAR